jgi:hypothetical protein
VLEGSVRRLGERVQVNAQLIDAETGAHAWADRFDMGSAADHPRRPKGLPKTGGRQRGTPNRRTLGLRIGLVAAGAPLELAEKTPRQLPLDFLLEVMADENQPIATRVDAAKAAAPYVHFRKGLVDTTGRDVPLTVQVIRFTEMAGKLEAPDREADPKPLTIEHDPPPASH